MARVVVIGYGQMFYSLIKGIEESNKHQIVGVFRSDRVFYDSLALFFKDIFNPSRDYIIVKSKKLYDIKGNSVNSNIFYEQIQKLNPDLIIVGSWSEKFKKRILDTVPCINFHPSLLPQNRGANPYFWTIYNNQKTTGLTVHYMDEKFDRGDIISQYEILIDEDETGKTLKNKTTRLAREVVGDILDLFDSKQMQPVKQNEAFANYQHQIQFENTIIDLKQPKVDVSRHLRALYPWAKACVGFGRRYVMFEKYEFLENDSESKPYKIIEDNKNYILVAGLDFLLKIYK